MRKRTIVAGAGVAFAAAMAVGGVAVASGGQDGEGRDSDATVTGPQAEDATVAALAATSGGRANSVERDSENGATWEVEVTRDDGTTVDVRLDQDYDVVVIEGDGE